MGVSDRMQSKAQEMKGAAKEKVGEMAGNERMRGKGATERVEAKARQAGEHMKEAGRRGRETFTG